MPSFLEPQGSPSYHMILIFTSKVALDAVLQEFPNYGRIHNKIYVRITGLPLADHLRELRCDGGGG